MITLTARQEQEILEYLGQWGDGFFITNGAARLVFSCPVALVESMPSVFGITKDVDEAYEVSKMWVIKVAMGEGGMNQLANEINCYEELGNEYDLAEVLAGGKFVEIMECVKPIDSSFRDCWNSPIERIMRFTNLSRDVAERAFIVANSLIDIFGDTSDNGQLGFTTTGRLVSYDYAFYKDTEDTQTSDICDFVDYDEQCAADWCRTLAARAFDPYEGMSDIECDWINSQRSQDSEWC